MKKSLLVFSVFLINFFAFSQEITRENVQGKIIVEGSSLEGITIFNSSSKLGTVTNEKGYFEIQVAVNDIIEISALEYKKINITVNESIIASKKINVFLIEEVNKLEEVVVVSRKLTGDLKTDVVLAKKYNPKEDSFYFGIKNTVPTAFNNTTASEVTNVTMQTQTKNLVDGLNIINVVDQLLIPLFRSEVADKKALGVPEVPANAIKYYLGSDFLVENFNIPMHRVEEFIRYVEDETFDFNLLNYGNEMELLELIHKKSELFLNPVKVVENNTTL